MDMSTPFFGSKKGISPLIAAVLLIAFTMTIAAILATWAQTFGEERLGEASERAETAIECPRINLDIESANFTDGENLVGNIILWNRGQEEASDITFVVYDGTGPNMFDEVSYQDGSGDVNISSGNFARLEAGGGDVSAGDIERLEVHAQADQCPDVQPIDTCGGFDGTNFIC